MGIGQRTLRRYLRMYQAGGTEGLKALNFYCPKSELDKHREQLKAEFECEYSINKASVTKANIEFRKKLARKRMISLLVARDFEFSEIPELYKKDLFITEYEYNKALNKYRVEQQ